jgi:hypothetical protein
MKGFSLKRRNAQVASLFVILITMLYSCVNKQTGRESILSDWKDRIIDYSFVDTSVVFIIPLEATPESVIGRVGEFLFDDDRIFHLDGQTKEIQVYDMRGKYLTSVKPMGRGPGEYTQEIRTFDLDRARREIIVYDGRLNKMIRYTYDGTFNRENSFEKFHGVDFAYLGSDRYVFRVFQGEPEVVVTDSVGGIISVANYRKEVFDNYEMSHRVPFFSKNSNMTPFYIPMWDDKIYTILADGTPVVVKDLNLQSQMVNKVSEMDVLRRHAHFREHTLNKYSFFNSLVVSSDSSFYVQNTYLDGQSPTLIAAGRIGKGVISYGSIGGNFDGRGWVDFPAREEHEITSYPKGSHNDKFYTYRQSFSAHPSLTSLSRWDSSVTEYSPDEVNLFLLFFGVK